MEVGTRFDQIFIMSHEATPPDNSCGFAKWYADPNLAMAYWLMEQGRYVQAIESFERYLAEPLLPPGETVAESQPSVLIDMAYCLDKVRGV